MENKYIELAKKLGIENEDIPEYKYYKMEESNKNNPSQKDLIIVKLAEIIAELKNQNADSNLRIENMQCEICNLNIDRDRVYSENLMLKQIIDKLNKNKKED